MPLSFPPSPAVRFCLSCGKPLIAREEGGAPRQACADDACGYVFYGNPVPVVAAVVERDGAVLLARARHWPEKMFGLVAGFLEREEDPAAGVLRELQEETGLAAEVVSLIGVYPFAPMNQLIVAYHLRAGAGELRLSEELLEAKWITIERLRPWPLGTGQAVSDWLARYRAAESPSARTSVQPG